ncbi:MAG: aminotransferase class I/II-fold pyridoxal phosphate-dependent enzyme [Carboxylicivirga sp.]|nr:aminotransferase class I/II-fold pyridoxal phosphate-dependent enzyme [Carboxylicivirga sp.]
MREFIDIPDMNMDESIENFQHFINQFQEKQTYPYGFMSDTAVDKNMTVKDFYTDKVFETISFVSNNYLGLSQHPKVKQAAKDAIDKYGVGTCAAPPIGGYINIHKELEGKLAKLHGKEKAILFNSGYSANIGVFQNMFNKSDIVFTDMFVHASIYDGLRNNTNVKIYKHNDMDYLELILKREQGKYRNMTIVVDGVFSQDGDLANLPVICDLAEKYGAMVFVDDAHGAGVLGKNGKGTLDHFDVEDRVDLVIGTFSKSMGTAGGYIAGSEKLVEYMRHFSRSNIFSVSVAPAIVAAASKAIDLFEEEPQHIKKLWDNTRYLKQKLTDYGFDIGQSETPITPLMIRDDEKTLFTARKLLENGIYVIPAIYPAVKINDSRFRVSVTAQHDISDLDIFCKLLLKINQEFKLNLIK